MKNPIFAGLIIFAVASFSQLRSSAAASPTSADQAWTALQDAGLLGDSEFPADLAKMTKSEQRGWFEQRALRLGDKGLEFYKTFPRDPRRWVIVARMLQMPPSFVVSHGSGLEGNPGDFSVDEAKVAAWKIKLAELEATMSVATDVPPPAREVLDGLVLSRTVFSTDGEKSSSAPTDIDGACRAILAFATKYPDSDVPLSLSVGLMDNFEATHLPRESLAVWQELAGSPNQKLSGVAQRKIPALTFLSKPIDLLLTALDGRPIDLKVWRGRVVLLDFWATWCAPCMAEMPFVRKIYAAYHDQGFEVVGISCEGARRTKMGQTGLEILAFTQRKGMSWPQYYDESVPGEREKSLQAQFAVTAIPAIFLIDRSGNLAAMNLHGEALERKIRDLLQQQSGPAR